MFFCKIILNYVVCYTRQVTCCIYPKFISMQQVVLEVLRTQCFVNNVMLLLAWFYSILCIMVGVGFSAEVKCSINKSRGDWKVWNV